MTVKLSRVARAQLFAAHGADFAVDLDLAVNDDDLCMAAGRDQSRQLQQAVKADKLGRNPDLLSYVNQSLLYPDRQNNKYKAVGLG